MSSSPSFFGKIRTLFGKSPAQQSANPASPNRWRALFPDPLPFVAVLHLRSKDEKTAAELALHDAAMLLDAGADALLLQSYTLSGDAFKSVAKAVRNAIPDATLGVSDPLDPLAAFDTALAIDARFVWLDDVRGGLTPGMDALFAQRLAALREASSVAVVGGVRYLNIAVQSGGSLEEDARIAAARCDALMTGGKGAGFPATPEKLVALREALTGTPFADTPILAGAGVVESTAWDCLPFADGGIVGRYPHIIEEPWVGARDPKQGAPFQRDLWLPDGAYDLSRFSAIADAFRRIRDCREGSPPAGRALLRWLRGDYSPIDPAPPREGWSGLRFSFDSGAVDFGLTDPFMNSARLVLIDLKKLFPDITPNIAIWTSAQDFIRQPMRYPRGADYRAALPLPLPDNLRHLRADVGDRDGTVTAQVFRANDDALSDGGVLRLSIDAEKNYAIAVWHIQPGGAPKLLFAYEDC